MTFNPVLDARLDRIGHASAWFAESNRLWRGLRRREGEREPIVEDPESRSMKLEIVNADRPRYCNVLSRNEVQGFSL